MTVYDCGELISKAAQVIEHQSVQNVNDITLGITQFISDNNKCANVIIVIVWGKHIIYNVFQKILRRIIKS